jgi:hypothetical protein
VPELSGWTGEVVPRLDRAVERIGGWRTVRVGLTLIGLLWLAGIAFGILPYNTHPNDSHAYWAVDPSNPYRDAALGSVDAFLYAPAIAQLLAPFTLLPFEVFRLGYGAVSLGALWLSGAAYTLVVPGVIEDLVRGNIHVLIAVVLIIGFRYPAAWSFVLLTKVTPGIGLLWFAIRREWRPLAWVTLATAAIVAISVLIGGIGLWEDWIRLLASNAGTSRTFDYGFFAMPPFGFRLPFALAVIAWAAVTGRRWAVPIAAFLALPVIWPSGYALLAAVPPLWIADRQTGCSPAVWFSSRGSFDR